MGSIQVGHIDGQYNANESFGLGSVAGKWSWLEAAMRSQKKKQLHGHVRVHK